MLRSLFICFLVALLQTQASVFAQTTSLPVEKWVKDLNSKNDHENTGYLRILDELNSKDSITASAALHELERFTSANHYFKARLFCLKAEQGYRGLPSEKAALKPLCQQAMTEAYETGDDYLIRFVSRLYGYYMVDCQENELAIIYYLKANEINERLEKKINNYGLEFGLGELLYHAHEYVKSIEFLKKALASWKDTTATQDTLRMRCFNTIGQAYKQLGQLDSALPYYVKSMQLANKLNHPVWKGGNVVYTAEFFFLRKDYDKAKKLIEQEYKVKYTDDANLSAYALELLAKINLVQRHNNTALRRVNEALELLRYHSYIDIRTSHCLKQVYYTAADVYRSMGNTDSFYHYNQLYTVLHDSLERVATLSSVKMAQLHINNEKNYHAVQQLSRQKEAEKVKRNFINCIPGYAVVYRAACA